MKTVNVIDDYYLNVLTKLHADDGGHEEIDDHQNPQYIHCFRRMEQVVVDYCDISRKWEFKGSHITSDTIGATDGAVQDVPTALFSSAAVSNVDFSGHGGVADADGAIAGVTHVRFLKW